MGIWRCQHRYRVRRLAGCNDWIEFDGTCAARKILGGLGNTDENDIAMPGGRYTGMSLRLWDPDSERWTIQWLDSRRPGAIGPPVRGSFTQRPDGPFGVFYGDDVHNGRAIRVRYIWSRIAERRARAGSRPSRPTRATAGRPTGTWTSRGCNAMTHKLFAVMRTRGPAWNDGVPMEEQVDWRRHADFMNGLAAEGFALLGGPLAGTRDVLLIVRAEERGRGRGAAGRGLLERPGTAAHLRIKPWWLRSGCRRLAATLGGP